MTMATLRDIFIVTIGMTFLARKLSYGHELFGDSLNQDERQSCSDTNCLGKDPCSNDTQCSPDKCCIDMINSLTCCHGSGTSTTEIPTTTDNGESPLCTDYYENPCITPEDCACFDQTDCYPNEVCCLEVTTEGAEIHFKFFCHSTVPLPPPPTIPPPGDKCPTTNPPVECAPLPTGDCTTHADCHNNQICCEVERGQPPCCVVYPPETVHN